MCNKTECTHCPFALTDESEYVQGLGCLPTPYEILEMKRQHGHNWACHEDDTKLCAGFARHAKQYAPELDVKAGGLISYLTWTLHGEEAALAQAARRMRPLDDAHLSPVLSPAEYEALDQQLRSLTMAVAKGEELPGDDERMKQLEQQLDTSGWYRNLDTGQLQEHPYA